LREGLDEAGTKLEDGTQQEVEDKRPFTAVTVRQNAEDGGTSGTEEQSQGDGGRLYFAQH
jgi:hypothetical protein